MKDQQIIKNVVLDLGGVLVDLDPEKTYSAFNQIFRPEALVDITWDHLPEVVVAMETGKWTTSKFINTMMEACKPGVGEDQMIEAWCAMLLDFKSIRLDMLRKLATKYKLFLLSNTNVYHANFFEGKFYEQYHFSLHELFSTVYYSHEIGYRKPNAEAFDHVLNDASLLSHETVMVDDRADNCLAAEAVGMKSIKVPENTGLEAVIDLLL
jgi:putative hydrolase of the HAD superfamily